MPGQETERERDDRWFLRDFSKAPGYLFDDPTFYRLPLEAQGVFWSALLFSMRRSKIPGWFMDRTTGTPLRDDELVYELARSVDRIEPVRAALRELRKAERLSYSPREGWSIPRYADDFCTTAERKKVRDADAQRKRRQRQNERSAGRKVVPLQEGIAR